MVEDILKNNFEICGVVLSKIDVSLLKEEDINEKNLKLCLLDNLQKPYSTKMISKLSLNTQINNDVIILYDFSKGLNNKELNYFQRLFNNMVKRQNKKIILFSRDIDFLFKFCDTIMVYQNKIIYQTKDFYDDKLYQYIDMPKMVSFIKHVNKKGANLKNTKDINELLKDIYRRKSES